MSPASSSPQVAVQEVQCKSILGESGICDYSLNCYIGCQHACAYCYARFMGRFHHVGARWGSFVDAKVNAPEALARQLAGRLPLSSGSVFMSSVCDAYQPAEEKYQLTRRCLALLLEGGFDVHVQTKSDLVRRDFDLLQGRKNVTLCQTITTMDPVLASGLEPGASPPQARVETLDQARRRGIAVKAFVGPLLPGLTDTISSLTEVFSALAGLGLQEVYVDRLNLRWGVWPGLREALTTTLPRAAADARAVLYDSAASQAYDRRLRANVRVALEETGLTAPLNMIV